MKSIYLLFLLISIKCISRFCGEQESASGPDECQNYVLPAGYHLCCYLFLNYTYYGKIETKSTCNPLTEYDYRNIIEYIENIKKEYEKTGTLNNLEIDCGDHTYYCSDIQGKSFNECKNLIITSNYEQCCYIHSEYEYNTQKYEENYCYPVTKSEYYDLKTFIETKKKEKEDIGFKVDEYNINCGEIKYYCDDVNGKSYKDCKNLKVTGMKKHCCHLNEKYKEKDQNIVNDKCIEINDTEYKYRTLFYEEYKNDHSTYQFESLYISCEEPDEGNNNANIIRMSLFVIILFLI